jgi:hypothetical protein
VAAAAAVEAEVLAAAEAVLTASGRIPGGHFVDLAELRRLIRQAREVTSNIYCVLHWILSGSTEVEADLL